jgi:hypothetical protein
MRKAMPMGLYETIHTASALQGAFSLIETTRLQSLLSPAEEYPADDRGIPFIAFTSEKRNSLSSGRKQAYGFNFCSTGC